MTTDLGAVVTKVACCPVENFERCVLAGGEGHLRLLGARQAIGGGPDDVVLKPLPDIALAHEGRIDAVAWNHEPIDGEVRATWSLFFRTIF